MARPIVPPDTPQRPPRARRAPQRALRRVGGAERGFTVIEMVIVVTIAGVLAALAAPNLSELVKNNTRTARINSMVTALNVARSEAVKLNASVSICPSGAGVAAAFDRCNGLGDGQFEDGWIAFVDVDSDASVDIGTDLVLRTFDPGMNEDGNRTTPPNLRGLLAVGGAAVDTLTYRGTGFLSVTPGTTHIVYCDDRGQESARAIAFSTTGQPRMARDGSGDADEIPDVGGVNLTCP